MIRTSTPRSCPVVTVIGKSGAGKTTLLVQLIAEFKRRGYRVGTIKHHSHSGFDIDKPGKDSWRHAQAGSDHVVIAAPDKLASYRRLEQEMTLAEITTQMKDLDIILVEGYKRAGMPSIEVVRAALSTEIISSPEQCFALVTDSLLPLSIPQFGAEDTDKLADLIEKRFLKS